MPENELNLKPVNQNASNDLPEGVPGVSGAPAPGVAAVSHGTGTLGLLAESVKSYDGFDPAIHAVGPDGAPKRKPNGDYAKKAGRKPGSNSPAPATAQSVASGALPQRRNSTVAPIASSGNDKILPSPEQAEMAAKTLVNGLINISVATFGEEWAPASKDEPLAMVGAWKNYFEENGTIDVPPWLVVGYVSIAYAGPRVRMPATKYRLGLWGAKMAGVGAYLRGRFARGQK